jgi:hypothetical protein
MLVEGEYIFYSILFYSILFYLARVAWRAGIRRVTVGRQQRTLQGLPFTCSQRKYITLRRQFKNLS